MLEMDTIAHYVAVIKQADIALLRAAVARDLDTDLEVTDMLVRLAASELRRRGEVC